MEWAREQGMDKGEWANGNGLRPVGCATARGGLTPATGRNGLVDAPSFLLCFFAVASLCLLRPNLYPAGSPTEVGVASFAIVSFISKPMFGRLGMMCLGTIVSVAKIKALSSTGPFLPSTLILRTH
jgi:hypothetical protein